MNGVTPLAGSKNESRMRDGVNVQNLELDIASHKTLYTELQGLLFKD